MKPSGITGTYSHGTGGCLAPVDHRTPRSPNARSVQGRLWGDGVLGTIWERLVPNRYRRAQVHAGLEGWGRAQIQPYTARYRRIQIG